MPIASYASFLGIAKEATPGTAVAATAFIPVTNIQPHIVQMYLPDEGLRASQAKTYGETPGVAYAEFDFGGSVFPDTIGFALVGLLGDVATTGASAPFTHTATLLNSGVLTPTYTLSDYNGFNTRQYAGCRFSELAFKFAGDGLLEYTAKAFARTFATTTKPTASFGTLSQVPGWKGTATIGGVASSLIVDGQVDIKRTGEPIHNVDGAVGPYDIFVGSDLEATGTFTAVYEDDTIITPYLNGTVQSLVFDWQQGAGAALTEVKLQMTQVQIDDAQINRTQGKYVELACKFTALANTTDKGTSGGYAPILGLLQNANASGTYK